MRNLSMMRDLYQLTMMNGYLKNGMKENVAVFDLFFRPLQKLHGPWACALKKKTRRFNGGFFMGGRPSTPAYSATLISGGCGVKASVSPLASSR